MAACCVAAAAHKVAPPLEPGHVDSGLTTETLDDRTHTSGGSEDEKTINQL